LTESKRTCLKNEQNLQGTKLSIYIIKCRLNKMRIELKKTSHIDYPVKQGLVLAVT